MYKYFRFTIRDLGIVTVLVALILGWFADHRRLATEIEQLSALVRPACSIEGRVTYHDSGKPAAGVRIQAQVPNRSFAAFLSSDPQLRTRAQFAVAKTDADGHYKFVDLLPSNWNVFVEEDGWTANAIDSLPVDPGVEAKAADLQLIKGGIIKGRVIDSAGNPVAQAGGQRIIIGVYGPARPKSGGAIQGVYVDAKGQFQIQVPPGKNYPYISSVLPSSIIEGNEFEEEGVTVVEGKTTEVQFHLDLNPRARPAFPPVQAEETKPVVE